METKRFLLPLRFRVLLLLESVDLYARLLLSPPCVLTPVCARFLAPLPPTSSMFPKSSPETFATKLYQTLGTHPRFEKPKLSQTGFIIDHYAGKVREGGEEGGMGECGRWG